MANVATTADMDALAARIRAQREAAGLNVHFINGRGELDSHSYASPARRDAFIAQLGRMGREIVA